MPTPRSRPPAVPENLKNVVNANSNIFELTLNVNQGYIPNDTTTKKTPFKNNMSTTSNIAKGGYKVENNDNLFSVPTGSSRKRRRANENQTQTQAFAKAELARVKASIHYTHNSTTLPPSTKSTTNATSNTKNKNRVNQSGNSNYANHLDKKLNAKVSLHEQKRLKAAKFAMDVSSKLN